MGWNPGIFLNEMPNMSLTISDFSGANPQTPPAYPTCLLIRKVRVPPTSNSQLVWPRDSFKMTIFLTLDLNVYWKTHF